jgi:hypothetical protein
MKSNQKEPANLQGANKATTINSKGSNNFNNEMNSGEVGAAGGDNGASTLRELRKKHGIANNK